MKQIETGREMAVNAVLLKALEQICFNDDGDSNEMDANDPQNKKHPNPISST
jgi:hypothetical protein